MRYIRMEELQYREKNIMLFFIDESWQATPDKKYKVGILAATQMKDHDFNQCSQDVYQLKVKHLGYAAGNLELKGNGIFRRYVFGLEAKGIVSKELNLARDILAYLHTIGIVLFGSVVLEEREVDLECADSNQLERPFFFLFERIHLFMKENHPGEMAHLIFDDRGIAANKKISSSVSNFFHKSARGREFDSIIKVPYFAISTENIGIQLADMVAYTLGAHVVNRREVGEFYKKIKGLEFKSRTLFDTGTNMRPHYGFKYLKKKEAGDSDNPGRTT